MIAATRSILINSDEDSFVLGARTRLLRKEYRNLNKIRAFSGIFRCNPLRVRVGRSIVGL